MSYVPGAVPAQDAVKAQAAHASVAVSRNAPAEAWVVALVLAHSDLDAE